MASTIAKNGFKKNPFCFCICFVLCWDEYTWYIRLRFCVLRCVFCFCQKLCIFQTIRYGIYDYQSSLPCGPNTYQIIYGEALDLQWLRFHTLLDKYLDHMLVKFKINCVTPNVLESLELFSKKKKVNHFLKCVDAILEDFSVT